MLNVYSMFAGIGGFDLGLEATGGFRTVMQSEIEKYPQSVLREHWPDAIQVGDCMQVDYSKLNVSVDVICGGFPCQDISIAGKQVGITGSRSSLFGEMIRAAKFFEPEYILFENVRRLLTINNGRDFDYVLQEISDAGYDAEWRVCSAKEVGAPHQRERLFIVAIKRELGYTGGEGLQRCEPATEYQQPTLWDTEQYQIFTRPPKRSGYWDSAIRYRNRLVEPNIYQMVDGVSYRMDEVNADAEKTRPVQVLRVLQSGDDKDAIQRSARGSFKVPPEEVLFAILRRVNKGAERGWIEDKSLEASWEHLRSLRIYKWTSCPSCGRGYCAQCAREYPNTLCDLPPYSALESKEGRNGTAWKIGSTLLSTDTSNRAHQIKAYGNAIVPQVAEYVGWMVLQHWKRRGDSKHERGRVA